MEFQPQPPRHNPLRRAVLHVQTVLGAGLLVLLPIGVTALVLKFFFDLLDPILQDTALRYLPGPKFPGLGVLILVVLVYLVGLVTTRVIGRRFIDLGHAILERIPVVRGIYGTTRTAVGVFSTPKERPYSGVVLIEFPRKGLKSIGLVTANLGVIDGEEMLAVYVPTTPIPSSGFLILAPVSQVTSTEISVDDAMKVIISGGILASDVFAEAWAGRGWGSRLPDTTPPDGTGEGTERRERA